MEGWIKLYSKLTEWGWYDEPNTFRLFIHLLLTVNYKEKEWHKVKVMPGQKITSYAHLSEETGLSVKKIRTAMSNLKSTGEVAVKNTNKYSVITILKWCHYQSKGKQEGSQRATTKEYKNKDIYTASLPKARGVLNKKQDMRQIDERKMSTDYEETVDLETGLPVQAAKSTVGQSMKELLQWAADRRKFGFANVPKQYAAMKRMRIAGVSPDQVKERWKEMENDSYWQGKGFDFTSVVATFDKKR